MNRQELELQLVSDDAAEREALRARAAGDSELARQVAAHESIAREARSWGNEPAAVPPGLGERIVSTALARTGAGRMRRAVALAASLLVAAAALGVLLRGPAVPADAQGTLVAAEPLVALERTARLQAAELQQLEQQAAPLLARAGTPELPSPEAARLLALRDQLALLDQEISDVRQFLAGNPLHAQAHVALLAAYERKSEVLLAVRATG
jgi:hypothetical protein